jgi:hypothetical protein
MKNLASKIISTIIDGYKLEFDGVNYGDTTQITISKGKFYASLSYVIMNTCLYDDQGNDSKQISEETIIKFENWAEKVGY